MTAGARRSWSLFHLRVHRRDARGAYAVADAKRVAVAHDQRRMARLGPSKADDGDRPLEDVVGLLLEGHRPTLSSRDSHPAARKACL